MPTDDNYIVPPYDDESPRPQANRMMLGVLVALVAVAVLLALWFLLFDDDGATTASTTEAGPTPLTIATATPEADDSGIGLATTGDEEPTPTPAPSPTPLPDDLESCTADAAPSTSLSYVVDTNTTPLNQRSEPAVSGTQVGTFDPGQTGLVFTGECVVNTIDGYTWWKIFNGSEDVWVASSFVSPT